MRERCPVCSKYLVPPSGPSNADVLILGEYPGKTEMDIGIPWVGPAGKILETELARVGINMRYCRVANLWQHAPAWKDEREVHWHTGKARAEMHGRKAVLLMGSDVSRVFLDKSVMEVTGTQVKSKDLPPEIEVAVAMVNPASAMYGSMGEVRLAIERFGKMTEYLR